jgi:pimeloyl-ACP methyl ester carboxylesterase
LFTSGHTEKSFRYLPYQKIIINLVKKGFVVFAFDPVGQGERSQYIDPDTGKPLLNSVAEHCQFGNQCFLAGHNPAWYFIWDGIRAVDYLVSRREVDPQRIGITGHSGGGTQTAYIAAVDKRILAAAPECFITDVKNIIKSTGPQDAEQNLPGFTKAGLNHGDFIEVRAPKPTLILSVTRDFFSIQGARNTYEEAKRIYRAYEKADFLQMSESDTIHSTPLHNREARYAFFQKFLKNPGDPKDHAVQYFTEEELQVTATGQLATSMKGKTVFELNKEKVTKQLEGIEQSRKQPQNHLNKVIKNAGIISGFKKPERFKPPVFSGRYVKPNYELEKYLIGGSGNYYLPAVLYKPVNRDQKKLILLCSDKGKEWLANKNALAHDLIKKGYSVLLFDLPGTGELGPGYMHGYNAYFPVWYTGILSGKSIASIWAEDIIRAVHFAKSKLPGCQIIGAADGSVSSGLLLSAVFSPEISKMVMIGPLITYSHLLKNPFYMEKIIPSTIAGALKQFDLPDLYALLAPRDVLLINPLDGTKKVPDESGIHSALSFAEKIYSDDGAKNRLKIMTDIDTAAMTEQISLWLK